MKSPLPEIDHNQSFVFFLYLFFQNSKLHVDGLSISHRPTLTYYPSVMRENICFINSLHYIFSIRVCIYVSMYVLSWSAYLCPSLSISIPSIQTITIQIYMLMLWFISLFLTILICQWCAVYRIQCNMAISFPNISLMLQINLCESNSICVYACGLCINEE